jgi:hypothetical protein
MMVFKISFVYSKVATFRNKEDYTSKCKNKKLIADKINDDKINANKFNPDKIQKVSSD